MKVAIPSNPLLAAALDYVRRGWLVFPLHWVEVGACSCGSPKCDNAGKHPYGELAPSGFKDGTKDPEIVRGWWSRFPKCNVGIATGEASGIVVLDVDPQHGGAESLRRIEDEGGHVPETLEAETGGGGRHLIFAHPGAKVPNSIGRAGWLNEQGLDVRGDGGYIVAPPSNHKSGFRYAWPPMAGPADLSPAAVPEWMMKRLAARRQTAAPASSGGSTNGDSARYWLGKALAAASVGNRHDTAFWLACQLRDAGVSQSEAEGVASDYHARVPKRDDKPYPQSDAIRAVRDAYSTAKRDPAKGNGVRVPTYSPPPKPSQDLKADPKPEMAGQRLRSVYQGVKDGTIYNVPWPFAQLTSLTQALLPGTVTMFCAGPGFGKSLFILQCLQHWHGGGFDPSVFFIEDELEDYTMRILAQLTGRTDFLNYEWVKKHPTEIDAALDANEAYISELGTCIESCKVVDLTLDRVLEWVERCAKAKRRVIVVDPITAADTSEKSYLDEKRFVKVAARIVADHGVSLIATTHPKLGMAGKPGMGGMAGSASYSRFVHNVIWGHRSEKPRKVQYMTSLRQPATARLSYFFQLHKTRRAAGAGREIGFGFQGLRFVEQGVVLRDVPERDDEKKQEQKEDGNAEL